jgi:hypothetical protein
LTISATDILVPVCSKIPLLYLLTQKVAQKFGYVLGIKWDGDGFLLYQKRLERGTFELPFFDPQSKQCKMPYKTLSAIMSGICLKSMRYRKRLNL